MPLDPEAVAFAQTLFDMAREGRTDELAACLDAGLTPDLTNDKGDTLLILAAYHRHEGTVRALLAHGADSGRTNDRGQTALAGAAFRQDAAVVRALLDVGADPYAGGPTAVELARFFDLPEMLELLEPGPPSGSGGAGSGGAGGEAAG